MFWLGEFSPNKPELRQVKAQPFIGIGEHELFQKERIRVNEKEVVSQKIKTELPLISPKKFSLSYSKRVQTDIKDIHCPLIQYVNHQVEQNNNRQRVPSSNNDQFNTQLTSYRRAKEQQHHHLFPKNGTLKLIMDKPKGILTNRKSGNSRERYFSNLKQNYTNHTTSFLDGFSYTDPLEERERERKKREFYNQELRLQIEEKRRLQTMKDRQDRREQELENKRLEQQLLRMQEEALVDDCDGAVVRTRHCDDYVRSASLRKFADSESSLHETRNTFSHYSPPVSRRYFPQSSTTMSDPTTSRYNPHFSRYRRDALNRLDSLNVYDTLYDSYDISNSRFTNKKNAFARFDSLSRIDSLGSRGCEHLLNKFDSLNLQDDFIFGGGSGTTRQRRHSGPHQEYGLTRKSPKLQRRSNSFRFDDQLPIPVLKAHSPVAKELKHSIPFNSARCSSDACRKMEDKWQIPAVQKTIVNNCDSYRDGNRHIFTQLGAIRMHLQQEQLRMEETLRKRGISQSKAVDFR